MAQMTKDEFEDWLEDHREEALAELDDDPKPVGDWIRGMTRSLQAMADEPVDEDEIPDLDSGEEED